MFHRKLLSGISYVLGLLIILNCILNITMFVWSYFGVPPLQIIDSRYEVKVRYLLLLREIGTMLFLFIIVGAVKHFVSTGKTIKTEPVKIETELERSSSHFEDFVPVRMTPSKPKGKPGRKKKIVA